MLYILKLVNNSALHIHHTFRVGTPTSARETHFALSFASKLINISCDCVKDVFNAVMVGFNNFHSKLPRNVRSSDLFKHNPVA